MVWLLHAELRAGQFPGPALVSSNRIPEDVLPAHCLEGLTVQGTAAFPGIDIFSGVFPELFNGQDQRLTGCIECQQKAFTRLLFAKRAGVRFAVQIKRISPIALYGF